MKRIFLVASLVLTVLTACKSTQKTVVITTPSPASETGMTDEMAEHVWDFRDATTWLLGDINPDWLYREPHGEWYSRGINDYVPDSTVMKEVKKLNTEGLTITIVLGTWCPDSRREVPRFMKIVDLWGFPLEKIRMIGVDINKIAPLGEFSLLDIQRVPTFIFYEKNIEVGRIIEVPVTSLEQDMVKILTDN
jgi:hypothetical protein